MLFCEIRENGDYKIDWTLVLRIGCIDQLQRELNDHFQGIRKITRISDVVLPFLAARRRMLNSVCTNELKMAKAVVNEFINKVEVNTFIENRVRFSVTVRVSPIRFTKSYLSDFNTTVSIT